MTKYDEKLGFIDKNLTTETLRSLPVRKTNSVDPGVTTSIKCYTKLNPYYIN